MWNSTLPEYDTKLFVNIYGDVNTFYADYLDNGIPTTISESNCKTLYYLLYAKYGNNPIANWDENQFKYKLFSLIFMYGPTWEKRLSLQGTLRDLNLSDLVDDGQLSELFTHSGTNGSTASGTNSNTRTITESGTNTGTQATAHTGTVGNIHSNDIENSGSDTNVTNHAMNPSTSPATNAFDPLNYINDQQAQKLTKGTKSEQDESSTTTYNNTDTVTNNLANSKSGTIGDQGTNSSTVSGTDTANDSRTKTMTKGKLEGYEKLLELLDADVTNDFLSKFRILFKQFVFPARPVLYWTEEE